MKILEIVPKENAILFVRAEDGQTGLFDVKPFLDAEAFRSLKDEREFRLIHNGGYFVEWDCGADLSADTIFARWKVNSSKHLNKKAKSEKAYSVSAIRREFNQAYSPWTENDDSYLRKRVLEGASLSDLANEFGRQPSGIQSRMRKLGLGR